MSAVIHCMAKKEYPPCPLDKEAHREHSTFCMDIYILVLCSMMAVSGFRKTQLWPSSGESFIPGSKMMNSHLQGRKGSVCSMCVDMCNINDLRAIRVQSLSKGNLCNYVVI